MPLFLSRHSPKFIALITFIGSLSVGLWLTQEFHRNIELREQRYLDQIAHAAAASIERKINKSVALTQIMVSQLELMGPEKVTRDFETIAARLLEDSNDIETTLGLAPGGILKKLYPLTGTQAISGLNLVNNDLGADDAVRALPEHEQLILSGPYELLSGGTGIVGLNPVFFGEGQNRYFWGSIMMLLKLEDIVNNKVLNQFNTSGLVIQLFHIDKTSGRSTFFYSSDETPNADYIDHTITIPNGEWRIRVFSNQLPHSMAAAMIWTIFSALVLTFFAARLAGQPQELRLRVREKTAQLLAHDRFLNDMLKSLPVGIVVTDMSGRVRYQNPLFSKVIAHRVSENDSILDILDETVTDRSLGAFLGQHIDHKAENFGILLEMKHGLELQVDCSWVRTEQESVLVWVFRDVTEITSMNRTLRNVSATRADMLKLIPDAMVYFNKKGDVIEVNPAFRELFSGVIKDMSSFSCTEFEWVLLSHAENTEKFTSLCGQSLLLGRASEMDSSMPFSDEVVITLDKRTVFERTVRFDHKSSVVGSIMHFRDVTASRDVDRMKTEFLSTAAHELRTPMANIFGYTELLIKAQFDKQKQDELLNIIFNQTRRLSAILDDLLDLARIEARAGEAFKFDFHDVAQLVSDSIREQEIELSKHKLTVSIEQDIGQIWCDAEKLMQVIENLLSNAAKYSEDNTDIELAAISAGDGQRDGIEIQVTDSGAGMSEADRNRIFERFYRADTTGKIPGTGLGMSIVKEIVSHHQGLIDILSKPGEGTTVKVWIPRTPTAKTVTVPDNA